MAKNTQYELMIQIAGKVASSFTSSTGTAKKEVTGLGEAAKKAASVAAAAWGALQLGQAFSDAYESYKQLETAMSSMAAQTGATGEQLENLENVARSVYMDNFGDSVESAAEAVATVNNNIRGLSTDELQSATEAALALQSAFGYDAQESSRAAEAMRNNFGVSAEEAYGLIAAGAQNGLDFSNELIDSISEYSVQFAKLGFSADEMFNIFQSGADSSAWNLDKVGDAVKEFSIRAIDGSNTTIDAFTQLGYNADDMMAVFASGGDEANAAFFEVLNNLMSMDDHVKRDAIGVELFGTMWEDLGTEAMQAMANASTAAYNATDALGQINSVQFGTLAASTESINRQLESVGWMFMDELAPYAQEVLGYIANTALPEILPAIEDIAGGLGDTIALVIEFKDEIGLAVAVFAAFKAGSGIQSLVTGFGNAKLALSLFVATEQQANLAQAALNGSITFGETVVGLLTGKITLAQLASAAWSKAQLAVNAAMTANPIGLVITAIAALIAIVVLLYNKCDWFREGVDSMIAWIKTAVLSAPSAINEAVTAAIAALTTANPLLAAILQGWWSSVQAAWTNVKAIFTGVIDFVNNVFAGNWSAAWENIVTIFGNLFGLIVNLAKAPINAVISAINFVLGKINAISVTIPDWVPAVGGKTLGFSLPTIPALATGGIVTAPSLAQIGEGGEPEAVTLASLVRSVLAETRGRSVISELLDRLTNAMSGGQPQPAFAGAGGGGQPVTITYSPQYHFDGGTPSQNDLVAAERISQEEFDKKMHEWIKDHDRKDF